MPLVMGIDEAGYGPLLGPLVVGATLWQVVPRATRAADSAGDTRWISGDFWKALGACVARPPTRSDSRLTVGDSKLVFDRKRGIASLERPVLAFAHTAGLACPSVVDFLDALDPNRAPAADDIPWYRDLSQALPLDPHGSACGGIANRLRACMSAAGVTCCGLLARVVTEDVFNERVGRTRNKAAVLIEQVLRLLERGVRSCRDSDLYVFVDRLGGRTDYRALLLRAFPDRHLHVVETAGERSRYRLAGPRGDVMIEFAVNAEERHLPVALASMLAKYVRELLMVRFNAYWRERAPALRPTAGYYADAQRFLADIGPLVARTGLSTTQFVRSR